MSRDYPTNSDDILDGRDVIARRDELQEERDALVEALKEAQEARDAFDPTEGGGDEAELDQNAHHAREALESWDKDDGAELKALEAFIGDGSEEWRHGETLIRESYFEDYARELAEEIGALEKCDQWPATCIDWEKAARELQMDYLSADFDGVTYYYRG